MAKQAGSGVRIGETIALKVDEDLAKRIADVWGRVEAKAGVKVTLSTLLRTAIGKGLEEMGASK